MKKKNLLKTLAGVGLACVSGLGMVGCADIEVEQSKVDSLLQKGETFVDTQNEIDYKKLAEELQSYLDSEKTLTHEELIKKFTDDSYKLLETAMSQNLNYTFVNDDYVTRVEYVSDTLTKVYYYTLGENGAKTNEVYRELHLTRDDDGNIDSIRAKTYVKDLNLYSDVVVPNIVGETVHYIEFSSSSDDAYIDNSNHENDISWQQVFQKEDKAYLSYYDNAYDILVGNILAFRDNGMGEHYNIGYEIVDGEGVYTMENCYVNSKAYTSEYFKLKLTDNRYVLEGVFYTMDRAGFSEPFESINDITFDKENTLNFDTSGYTLIDGSYLAQ